MRQRAAFPSLIAVVLGLLVVAGSAATAGARAESSMAGPRYAFGQEDVFHHRHERVGPRRVYRILHRHGYRNIYSVRYHDRRGLYVAKGYTRHGRHVRVFVNPRSGRVVTDRRYRYTDRGLDRHDVIRRLVWAGYRVLSRPQRSDGVYVVRTEDRFGQRRVMHVDAYSGVIRHARRPKRGDRRRYDD